MISIILVYLIFFTVVLICSYYYELFTSKEDFQKSELTEIKPFFAKIYTNVVRSYRFPLFILVFILSSVLGILIPFLFKNWFFNSAVLFVAVFFIIPYLGEYFSKSMVTASDSLSDNIKNLFIENNISIVVGFGTGYASALIYNWRALTEIHSLFFVLNVGVIAVLMVIFIRKNFLKEKSSFV